MARQGGHRDAEAWVLETLGDAGIDELKAASSAGLYRQALQIRTELDDLSGAAACHVGLGRACYQLNDLDAATTHLETARQLSTETQDQWEFAVASAHLSSVLAASGDVVGARSLLMAVQTIFDEAEDLMSSGCTSTLLAGLAESGGEYEVALHHLEKALRTFNTVADVWSQAHIHRRIGDLHADRGNLHAAHRSWSAAAELLSGNPEPTAAGLRKQLIESLKEDV
jgi:tetratricopeptide (TPR) repeat protein